jgi:hypothetical protein
MWPVYGMEEKSAEHASVRKTFEEEKMSTGEILTVVKKNFSSICSQEINNTFKSIS